MCTVTVVAAPLVAPAVDRGSPRARLICSRDERRSRPRALPPAPLVAGSRRAVAPTDPAGGGTWVAVSDAGLAFALLNINRSRQPSNPDLPSRGTLIPSLLDAGDLEACLARAERVDGRSFNPCRLLVTDGRTAGEIVIRGGRLRLHRHRLDRPLLRISSSLGDRRVRRRRPLFQLWPHPRGGVWSRAVHEAFHLHRWPRKGAASVRMQRRDAATVSIASIELYSDRAVLDYREVIDGRPGTVHESVLPYRAGSP